MKRIINIVMIAILTSGSMFAQEMFVSSGAMGKSNKASLSWVVGGGISQGQAEVAPMLVSEVIAKENKALATKKINTK